MKKLFIISLILIGFKAYCQDFSENPLAFIQNIILENIQPENLNPRIPNGYEIVLNEKDQVIAEKSINNRIYDIKFYYEANKLVGIIITTHSAKILKLLEEAEKINFKLQSESVYNDIESSIHKNTINGLALLITNNERKREIMCSMSKPKNQI